MCGWIGGQSLHTADCSFKIHAPKALVAVQGLGRAPISTSEQILVTLMARVQGDEQRRGPFFSEPVAGTLCIRAPQGKTLVPLKPDGTAAAPLPIEYRDGKYIIALGMNMPSHWFLLR